MLYIVLYTLLWIFAGRILQRHYRRAAKRAGTESEFNSLKAPWYTILIISLLFTGYSYYVSRHVYIGADRLNYYVNYLGQRDSASSALQLYMDFLRDVLHARTSQMFASISFLCILMTMIAYRLSRFSHPYVMVLLFLTQYFFSTMVNLKQCFASAFATIFLVLTIEYDTKLSRVFSIICIIMACLFHPTGYLLFLLYFVLRRPTQKKMVVSGILLLFVGAFFNEIMEMIGTLLAPVLPTLASRIAFHMTETAEAGEGGNLGFLKGIPYYLIAIMAVKYRSRMKRYIPNYDRYLIVTITGAFFFLMSFRSIWLARYIYFFYYTIFVFYVQILHRIRFSNERFLWNAMITLSQAAVLYHYLYLVFIRNGML